MPSRYYTNPYFFHFTKLGQNRNNKKPPKLWGKKKKKSTWFFFSFFKNLILNLRMKQYCWTHTLLRYLTLSTCSSICTKIYLAVKYNKWRFNKFWSHTFKIIGNLSMALASNMSNPTQKLAEYYVSRTQASSLFCLK